MVVCSVLFVVCCSLVADSCFTFVVCCSSVVVCRSLFWVLACYLLLVVLVLVGWLLIGVACSVFVGCWLVVVSCSLYGVFCVYCL